MSRPRPSLVARALLAVGLMAGFYLLAVGTAMALLAAPVVAALVDVRIPGLLTMLCLSSAVLILWSIVPRPDRFVPPGVALQPSDQPRLWQEVHAIADATRQPAPVELYLTPGTNASVTHRGGIMAFGGRRVMCLGLFLLEALRIPELRGVLAHEFGHFQSGDVALAPWIYKTRVTLERTIGALSGRSRLLRRPFIAYATLFMRLTRDVSRREELAADLLAVRVVGMGPFIDGLKTSAHATVALSWYWSREVEPLLVAGFAPPLADGFARFVRVPTVAGAVADAADPLLREPRADPFDTHPSFQERVQALGAARSENERRDGPPASTLLANLPQLERDLLATRAPAGGLRPVTWEEVGWRVYAPAWEGIVQRHRAQFAGHTLDGLPPAARALAESLAHTHEAAWHADEGTETRWQAGVWMLGAAVGAVLSRAGWSVRTAPGAPVQLVGPSETLDPFAWAAAAAADQVDAGDWRARCERSRIAGLELAP